MIHLVREKRKMAIISETRESIPNAQNLIVSLPEGPPIESPRAYVLEESIQADQPLNSPPLPSPPRPRNPPHRINPTEHNLLPPLRLRPFDPEPLTQHHPTPHHQQQSQRPRITRRLWTSIKSCFQ